ncbi:hypothetical protein [Stenotrophomonas maltophilia]|uniref:hypothetical protein n=1 Tax=Stenotrophomonas maltophilia TaxID=40324 RepID=UPI00066E87F1|nr:hypothetical protein [Stenotrophomonas maltophilia]
MSNSLGRHLSAILPKPETGKLGFHSFRKTLIRHLHEQDVKAEQRAMHVGDDLGGEHHKPYSDEVPKQHVFDAAGKVYYPVKPRTDAFT